MTLHMDIMNLEGHRLCILLKKQYGNDYNMSYAWLNPETGNKVLEWPDHADLKLQMATILLGTKEFKGINFILLIVSAFKHVAQFNREARLANVWKEHLAMVI
ncbi:hypothetical protein BT96DRAFT_949263 [Gymnopus androsaceus JB14]|uniref:Uncharacterized protein n=1 Tax=Gymnopus androsaceus JB14 TaxID=1447944 RepID=A0A6A4GKH1_9AGAR|nr:hypothetical protein BT96DRAFT_949263 [Gymnopus androsaceus JB14]